jgi:hypothetical protein
VTRAALSQILVSRNAFTRMRFRACDFAHAISRMQFRDFGSAGTRLHACDFADAISQFLVSWNAFTRMRFWKFWSVETRLHACEFVNFLSVETCLHARVCVAGLRDGKFAWDNSTFWLFLRGLDRIMGVYFSPFGVFYRDLLCFMAVWYMYFVVILVYFPPFRYFH